MDESTGQAIHFAGATLDRHRHLRALLDGAEDELRVTIGSLDSNPFFMPPEEFLRELRDRRRD